jgi:DNA repair exonuclease SbcCD ATPase subunit
MEAAHTSWRSLGELFVERGLISEADLERALAEQVATKRRLADILVRRGLVTGHDITNALMEQLGSEVPMDASPAPAPAPARAPAPAPAPVAEHTAEIVPLPDPVQAGPAAAAAATEQKADAPKKASRKKSEPEVAELNPEAPHTGYDLPISAHALIAEADSRRRVAESELAAEREAHAQVLRGLEQVRAELDARDLSTDSLARELEETQTRLRTREDELSAEDSIWDEARREAERAGGQLAELRVRLEEKEHELSEASASAAAWTARATELEAETDTLAARVTAAGHVLEVLASTRFAANGADMSRQATPGNGHGQKTSGQTGVLYFVPQAEGYDLVERDGALPSVGETLEFGEQQFVVTKIGRSPLPFDRRSCVFLTAL